LHNGPGYDDCQEIGLQVGDANLPGGFSVAIHIHQS